MTDSNQPPTPVIEPDNVPAAAAGDHDGLDQARGNHTFLACTRALTSFPALLGALLVAAMMAGTRANLPDPDTWWHLAVGQQILATHHWPTRETFSFTAFGDAWIAYEWLGEIVMAFVERLGGLMALQGLLLGLSSILALLVYYYAYLRSRNWKAAFVACFVTLSLATGFFTLRPEIMGYICFILVLICLEKYRQGSNRAIWALPPIFLLWVNTHGSFVLGFLALAIFWAGGLTDFQMGGIKSVPWKTRQRIHLELAGLLSVIALVVTPYGTKLAAYPIQLVFSQPLNLANIAEWKSIGFGEVWGKEVFALIFLFFLAALLVRTQFRLDELLLLALAIYLACVHRRFFPVAAIVLAPMIAVLLSRWIPKYSSAADRFVLNGFLIGAIIVAMVHFFPSRHDLDKVIASRFPQKSLNYIAQHPLPGNLFNDYVWGGYLIWKRGPEHKVFIDGRADVYEYAGVLGDYLKMVRVAPDTQFLLRKYSIQSCLLTRDNPLGTFLSELPGWRRAYEDKVSVLYVRNPGAPTAASAKSGSAAAHQVLAEDRAITSRLMLKGAKFQ